MRKKKEVILARCPIDVLKMRKDRANNGGFTLRTAVTSPGSLRYLSGGNVALISSHKLCIVQVRHPERGAAHLNTALLI